MAIDINKQENQNPIEKKETNGQKSKNILFAILIIALLATWGYIIWDKNNTRELVQQKDNQISSTSAQRDELQKALDDATVRYDQIKTDGVEKDSVILERDKEITAKKSKIQALLSKANNSAKDIEEAKKMIESLNVDIESYKAQIAKLEAANAELSKSNQTLTGERDQLQKDYDSSKEEIRNKENTINIGSTLHASRFNVLALNEKRSGKLKETSKAKKADKLRITFDLDENLITPSGTKTLYIIITDPNKKIISSENMGSGIFNAREIGNIPFTQKMDVDYTQNKRQTISFDWKGEGSYVSGNYKIEVYNNGFKIGEAVRPLK
jgi:predicted  nucleic acid-binding Zn-ribbon protein